MGSFNLDRFTENEEQKKKLLDVKQKKPDMNNRGSGILTYFTKHCLELICKKIKSRINLPK